MNIVTIVIALIAGVVFGIIDPASIQAFLDQILAGLGLL